MMWSIISKNGRANCQSKSVAIIARNHATSGMMLTSLRPLSVLPSMNTRFLSTLGTGRNAADFSTSESAKGRCEGIARLTFGWVGSCKNTQNFNPVLNRNFIDTNIATVFSQRQKRQLSSQPLGNIFNQQQQQRVPGQTLEQYGVDLTKLAKEGKLDPVIGRHEEIRRTLQILGE